MTNTYHVLEIFTHMLAVLALMSAAHVSIHQQTGLFCSRQYILYTYVVSDASIVVLCYKVSNALCCVMS